MCSICIYTVSFVLFCTKIAASIVDIVLLVWCNVVYKMCVSQFLCPDQLVCVYWELVCDVSTAHYAMCRSCVL